MAISEVPTGAVADTIGRKHSLLIGLLLAIVSIILFALAPTFAILLIGNSLWAIAITFMSGADLAFFYDTLKALGREGEYKNMRGKLLTFTLAAIAISSAIGGIIAETSLVLPFLIYLIFLAFSIGLVLLLKEPPSESHPDTGSKLSYRQTLQITLDTIRQQPNLRFSLLYSNLMPLGVFIVAIIFIQPYAVEIGLPYTALGFLALGLRGVDMLASANADRLVKKTGEWNWIRFAPVLVVIGLIGIGIVPSVVGIFIFAIASFSSSASRPLIEDLIQRQTSSSVRATILSVDSLIRTLMLALVEPALGFIADARGLPYSFLVMAIGTAVILFSLLLRWRNHWNEMPPQPEAE
jgi:MFS family permease